MTGIVKEWFVLYRNDAIYASRWDSDALLDIIKNNPDFTERENGVMPKATIVRYVQADAINF